MLSKQMRDDIIALIHREVVPAMGCTEPVAIALAVAKATELLGTRPQKIRVGLSANMLKNAMGVGIPGTGMIGLPIAIALGAIIGKSEYGLEVLKDVNPDAVAEGKKFIDEDRIEIYLDENAPSILHIDVLVSAEATHANAVISGAHTHFARLATSRETLLDELSGDSPSATSGSTSTDPQLDMRTVWEFATESPVEELSFILDARELNRKAAQLALDEGYGHSLGYTIRTKGVKYFGDTPLEHMLIYTSAACDARMAGAAIPVMSNSGSGNQGITATMPVAIFAEDCGASEEQTIRALILSHLTSIYIKQSLGRLSALCGCVVASTGSSSGIVYLMGGGFDQVQAAIKNMVANLTGMVCDGAKPSCAMKISSGVSTALMSALLAMEGRCVTCNEGIVSEDVDRTIHNLTSIGRDAMRETDRLILNIMTTK
ncbi:MAG: L-serine ammonia-lyase, iron-sulfur-dependent, subunit alpha [Prevotella sp.]|nr:L-serine ammonia-lyase, iron-sulfur-dependent, subunit alpha [Prevotella sp.]MCM1074133.1 L-serine ammonia-lyase, iron-sulfur-dependent, subunit alpha [Ruminococcus sp.]